MFRKQWMGKYDSKSWIFQFGLNQSQICPCLSSHPIQHILVFTFSLIFKLFFIVFKMRITALSSSNFHLPLITDPSCWMCVCSMWVKSYLCSCVWMRDCTYALTPLRHLCVCVCRPDRWMRDCKEKDTREAHIRLLSLITRKRDKNHHTVSKMIDWKLSYTNTRACRHTPHPTPTV